MIPCPKTLFSFLSISEQRTPDFSTVLIAHLYKITLNHIKPTATLTTYMLIVYAFRHGTSRNKI